MRVRASARYLGSQGPRSLLLGLEGRGDAKANRGLSAPACSQTGRCEGVRGCHGQTHCTEG